MPDELCYSDFFSDPDAPGGASMNDTDQPKVFGVGNVAWPKGWTPEMAAEWRKKNGLEKPADE